MLDLIRTASRVFRTDADDDLPVEGHPERRQWPRFPIWNRELVVRSGQSRSVLRLKDISCGGACGITDLALAPGAILFLELPGGRIHAGRVRWVRNTNIGIKFVSALEFRFVLKLFAPQCGGSWPRPSNGAAAELAASAANDRSPGKYPEPALERSERT